MFQIIEFNREREAEWDEFIETKSVNGTFLQSRNFLNYHSEQRFRDCSLLIYDLKGNLCAVCPACLLEDGEEKIFYSHKGSTFGGIVIARKYYRAQYVLPMLEELLQYWRQKKYNKVYLRLTSDIFSEKPNDLLQYALYYYGFQEYKELSTYIDFSTYNDDIMSNFTQMKRRIVRNCLQERLTFRTLETQDEIEVFYDILCGNLAKYNVNPVHTVREIIELKRRLQDQCELYACFYKEEMVAGVMLFYFNRVKAVHTQYLAAKPSYRKLSPMTFVYYSVIKEMKERGYKKISWGISTEHFGKVINRGLIKNKEDFGSSFCNNLTYCLEMI